MNSNYTEVLRNLIHRHRLEQKAIALGAGINENTLVKILNGKSSPTIRTLEAVLGACEEKRPGFTVEYHRALLEDKMDIHQFVNSLNSSEISTLLFCLSQRFQNYQPVAVTPV